MKHEAIEKNSLLMAILITVVISVGGIVEIVPLFFLKSTIPPLEGVKPYTALELEGRDIYIKEGCYNCHSQMIRPFRAETERYGPYPSRRSRCTTTRSSGVPRGQGRTLPGSGRSILIHGISSIWKTRRALSLSLLCRGIRGSRRIGSMEAIYRRRCP